MNFFTQAAGFAKPRVAALALTGNAAPRVQPSAMFSTGVSPEAALQRISGTVRESAITRHQFDFARVGRHAEALSELTDTLADLKSRMARKAGGRSRAGVADAGFQLTAKAS